MLDLYFYTFICIYWSLLYQFYIKEHLYQNSASALKEFDGQQFSGRRKNALFIKTFQFIGIKTFYIIVHQ